MHQVQQQRFVADHDAARQKWGQKKDQEPAIANRKAWTRSNPYQPPASFRKSPYKSNE
jgi:hypothetical protein